MGGTYMVETAPGATLDEAYAALLDGFREQGWVDAEHIDYDTEGQAWADPFHKGFVRVLDKPVTESATEWMRGWVAQNPPEGVDPDNKWGPWMAFPLAAGGWMFFGWVNT